MVESTDKFSVFVPFEILEKAGTGDKKEMVIKGVASTDKEDTDEETLVPEGFELQKFLKSGFLNYNHLASKDPSMIIGEPTKAFAKGGQLHIEGVLYPDSEMACKVYETAKVLKKSSKTRALGFSIEGKALERDPLNPKRITKASITGCAITPSPKNPGTSLEIVKGGIDAFDFSPEDGTEFLIDVTDEFGVRTTVDKNFVIEKSHKEGEGSRGGHVIGHTRSGKPIYDNKHASKHSDFNSKDHLEASEAHHDAAEKHQSKYAYEGKDEDREIAKKHRKHAEAHASEARAKAHEGTIGTTRSGKAIYKDHNHPAHESFTRRDHIDAQDAHADRINKLLKKREGVKDENKRHAIMDEASEHHKSEMAHKRAYDRHHNKMADREDKIGYTRSGKAIYGEHDHEGHKDFDANDHQDAAEAHSTQAMGHEEHYRFSNGDYTHARAADAHKEQAAKHELEARAKGAIKKAEGTQEASTAAEMDGVTAKESLEGAKKKKKKKTEQDKEIFSKAETYEEIFSMFNCNVEDAPHLYKLIEGIQYVLTPNMEKTQISKEAILKAQEILGLVTAPTTQAEPAKEDAAKKADDLKKAEIQAELDAALKKADELKALLAGTPKEEPKVEPKTESKVEIAKAEDNDLIKAMNEKFTALGTMIAGKDQEIESIKTENAELKKGIEEITAFNQKLAAKIGMIEQQPLDRKSVSTTKFIEKGEGENAGVQGQGMQTLSLSNKQHRAALADILFKGAVNAGKDGKPDNELAKAVQTVELGSLGDTPQMSARLQQRLQSEFKINVVK